MLSLDTASPNIRCDRGVVLFCFLVKMGWISFMHKKGQWRVLCFLELDSSSLLPGGCILGFFDRVKIDIVNHSVTLAYLLESCQKGVIHSKRRGEKARKCEICKKELELEYHGATTRLHLYTWDSFHTGSEECFFWAIQLSRGIVL